MFKVSKFQKVNSCTDSFFIACGRRVVRGSARSPKERFSFVSALCRRLFNSEELRVQFKPWADSCIEQNKES
jgi:hypothetical protein